MKNIKNNSGISNLIVVLVILVLIFGGYLGYKFLSKNQISTTAPSITQPVVKKAVPTDAELIESIRRDMKLNKNESITIDNSNEKESIKLYVVNDKYEVIGVSYQFAHHILSRAVNTDKWVHEFGTQQAYDCAILDRLGLTYKQTVQFSCLEYNKNGSFRK